MNYTIRKNIKSEPRAIEFENNETANIFLAAPDMYEALKFTVRQIEELHKVKGDFGLTNAILGLTKQVLAKAEGK